MSDNFALSKLNSPSRLNQTGICVISTTLLEMFGNLQHFYVTKIT